MKSQQPTLNELKLEALESYSKYYNLIALVALNKLPIEALPPDFIRSMLHYISGEIVLHEKTKQQAREKN